MTRTTRAALRENLNAHFTVDELQLLADDLGVEFAGLPGDGKEAKALHFIRQVEAQGKVPALLMRCRTLRPDVAWGDDIAQWDKIKPFVMIAIALIVTAGAVVAVYIGQVDAVMPKGTFNIAVAEFGLTNGESEGTRAAGGSQISASVFQRLNDALNALPDEIKVDHKPLVWFDGLSLLQKRASIGVIPGSTLDARRENAALRSKDLNANLLIYGNYKAIQGEDTTRAELTPEFYTRSDSRDADEFTGRHQLGRPITIKLGASGVVDTGASSALRTRQEALSRIAIALLLDANGSNDRALEFLKRADAELPRTEWPDQDGRELLYYLIGREALLLSGAQNDEPRALALLDQSAGNFERALAINATYPAARLALASTRVQQANWMAKRPFASVNWAGVALTATQAITDTLEAQSLKGEDASSPFQQKARAVLGDAHRLLGVAQARLGQFAASKDNLDKAVRLIEAQLQHVDTEQTRFRAQLHLLLGVAYHERARLHKFGFGNIADSAADYQLAAQHYQACINDPNAHDDSYVGRLRDLQCGPYLALLEKER